ncbi:TPA: hypothetical protein PXB34_002351 [Mannheimia haemolytica]|nr:hypothetical protein [Mannheimia haemolytica]
MTRNIETGVEIVAVGKLQYSTYPQYSRQNAIMLINRKIERFNVGRDKPISLYKE